jgi:hypothetical protein
VLSWSCDRALAWTEDNLDKDDGDYYRVKEDSDSPPEAGWVKATSGIDPSPRLKQKPLDKKHEEAGNIVHVRDGGGIEIVGGQSAFLERKWPLECKLDNGTVLTVMSMNRTTVVWTTNDAARPHITWERDALSDVDFMARLGWATPSVMRDLSNLQPGDRVRVTADAEKMRRAFDEIGYSWDLMMNSMLGKVFLIRTIEKPSNGTRIVGLPSPDGSQGGTWFFPIEILDEKLASGRRRRSSSARSRSRSGGDLFDEFDEDEEDEDEESLPFEEGEEEGEEEEEEDDDDDYDEDDDEDDDDDADSNVDQFDVFRIGDDACSWSVDGGTSGTAWHRAEAKACSAAWAKGDVIGIAIDFDAGTIWVSKNGQWEKAFSDVDKQLLKDGVFPALTLRNVACSVNFGAEEFLHPPPDDSGFIGVSSQLTARDGVDLGASDERSESEQPMAGKSKCASAKGIDWQQGSSSSLSGAWLLVTPSDELGSGDAEATDNVRPMEESMHAVLQGGGGMILMLDEGKCLPDSLQSVNVGSTAPTRKDGSDGNDFNVGDTVKTLTSNDSVKAGEICEIVKYDGPTDSQPYKCKNSKGQMGWYRRHEVAAGNNEPMTCVLITGPTIHVWSACAQLKSCAALQCILTKTAWWPCWRRSPKSQTSPSWRLRKTNQSFSGLKTAALRPRKDGALHLLSPRCCRWAAVR